MQQCPKCGSINQDDSVFCNSCGTPLSGPTTNSTSPEIKPKRRGLMVAILCIILVAAIGIGAAVWVLNSKPKEPLEAAVEKTLTAMSDLYAQNDSMAAIGKAFDKLMEDEPFSFGLNINDSENMFGAQFHIQENAGLFNVETDLIGVPMQVSFYVDQEQIQLSAPGLLDGVYGMPTENLEENLKKSWIGQNMDIDFDTSSVDLDQLFSPASYEKELNAFVDSIKTEELSSVDLSLGDATRKCTPYKVTCDEEAALDFLKAAYLENPLFSTATSTLSYDDSYLQEIIGESENFEFTMFVDDRGYWVGTDIMNQGDGLELRFIGTENICQTVSLTAVSMGTRETIQFVTNVSQDELELVMESVDHEERLTFLHCGKDGIVTLLPDVTESGKLQLASTDSGLELTLIDELSDVHFTMGMYALQEKIAPLADTYTNLLEMDENDFMALIASISGY